MIRKFNDLDGDGNRDPGEPMLAGIPFEFWENGNTYKRITEADGTIKLCFPEQLEIVIREMRRQVGGQWTTTTTKRSAWRLECGLKTVWIGNQHIGVPQTGSRGAKHTWSSPSGPFLCF